MREPALEMPFGDVDFGQISFEGMMGRTTEESEVDDSDTDSAPMWPEVEAAAFDYDEVN